MGGSHACALLVLTAASVFAAPTMNYTTSVYKTEFGLVAPEPRGRGTYAILFSCTATYVFCVWTAVHPNIIAYSSTKYRIFYKFILAVLSIIIPEGILIGAFGQYREAHKLRIRWAAKRKEWIEDGKVSKDSKDTFDMSVAFFVVMGGFVIDESWETPTSESVEKEGPAVRAPPETSASEFIEKEGPAVRASPETPAIESVEGEGPTAETRLTTMECPRCKYSCERELGPYTATLTPAGFLRYLDEGYIHERSFDIRSITDKGKASNIAKVLAGMQALWLFVQCISRWASDLPLTLLEIHVGIQVMCAVIMYLCWWRKPSDVNEPIKITLHKRNHPEEVLRLPSLEERIKSSTTYSRIEPFITKQSPPNLMAITVKAFYDTIMYIDTSQIDTPQTGSGGAKLALGAMLAEGILVSTVGALHAAAWNIHFPTDVECLLWRLSSLGMVAFPLVVVFIGSFSGYQWDLINEIWAMHLDMRCAICFPADSIGVAARISQKHAREGSGAHTKAPWQSLIWYLVHYLLVFSCLLFILGYTISVIFITVESFISIRNPPGGAFYTPMWSDYWPHL